MNPATLDPFTKYEERSFIHFRKILKEFRIRRQNDTVPDIKTLPGTPTSWRGSLAGNKVTFVMRHNSLNGWK